MRSNNEAVMPAVRIDRVVKSRVQEVDLATVPFSSVFSDHLYSAEFRDGRWSDGHIQPYGPISVSPSISALHYGISVFDGMKAHKSPEGRPLLFRPRENARRLQRSAARLAMPAIPESLFLDGLHELVRVDQAWIPPADVGALYIRPILFSVDPSILAGPKMNPRDTSGCSQNPSPITMPENSCPGIAPPWRRPESRFLPPSVEVRDVLPAEGSACL
jgi:branched-chain amino acid aminotransferase